MIRIRAEKREKFGKEYSKKIRREGFIPAVLYSKGKVYCHLKVKLSDMNALLKEEATKFEIEIDGKVYLVYLKDVQVDPITQDPIHFDFYVIEEKNII